MVKLISNICSSKTGKYLLVQGGKGMKRRCWEKVISLVLAGAIIVNAPCNYVSAEDLFFSSEIENQEYEPAEEVEPGEEAGATEEMKPGEKAESTEETESDEEAKSAEQVEATKTPDEDFLVQKILIIP